MAAYFGFAKKKMLQVKTGVKEDISIIKQFTDLMAGSRQM
jgi:hypothetical protein